MHYVNVVVVTPDGNEFDAEVDAEAEDETLIRDLVRNLNLPKHASDGRTPIEYAISVIGSTRIKEGATLQLYEVPRSAVKSIRPRK